MSSAEDPYPAKVPIDDALASPPVRRRGSPNRNLLTVAIVAFLLGGTAVGFLAWRGALTPVLPASRSAAVTAQATSSPEAVTALETRLALLENRFSRLDQEADQAAGTAGKAERLLIAQATRRSIERGQPLGYLADQLRLRFAETQPRAVETLIAFSQRPTTLDALDTQLDMLAPQLAQLPRQSTSWERMRSVLASLFMIRSDAGPMVRSEQRIDRIKLQLAEGDVDAAIDLIQRLPGAPAAAEWSINARRFGAARQALDVIESSAMAQPQLTTAPEAKPASQPSQSYDAWD